MIILLLFSQGSLDGLDWSIKADILLPHPYIYRSITDILTKKVFIIS